MKWIGRFLAMLRESAPIRFWAMMGAAIALTIMAIGQIWIIWRGGWPVTLAPVQLNFLGWSLMITLIALGAIVLSLTNQRFSARGLGGSIDIAGEDDQAQKGQGDVRN